MNAAQITRAIYKALEQKGFKGSIVSIEHVSDLKKEIKTAYRKGFFDEVFYRERLTVFDFSVNKQLPEAKSIVITTAPQPQQTVCFDFKGNSHHFTMPPTYSYKTDKIIEKILFDALRPQGFTIKPARLPQKLLAVRAGMAQYGKNNIAYIEGMGSFHRLKVFLSDLPPVEDKWLELKSMEKCNKCSACIKKCPTATIVPDSFLIRAERCLTFHNERKEPFPDWLKPSWHNCLIGCMTCQSVCPANKKFCNWFEETEHFTEKETDLILKGTPQSQLPSATVNTLRRLDLLEDLNLLPRNLDVLLKQR